MRHDEQALGVRAQMLFEPDARLEVEVVRGLVEEQNSSAAKSACASETRIRQPPDICFVWRSIGTRWSAKPGHSRSAREARHLLISSERRSLIASRSSSADDMGTWKQQRQIVRGRRREGGAEAQWGCRAVGQRRRGNGLTGAHTPGIKDHLLHRLKLLDLLDNVVDDGLDKRSLGGASSCRWNIERCLGSGSPAVQSEARSTCPSHCLRVACSGSLVSARACSPEPANGRQERLRTTRS